MRLSGDDYSKRLEEYSNFTLVLISAIHCRTKKETISRAHDITTDSELDEKQVVEKLLELLAINTNPLAQVSLEDALYAVCDTFENGDFYSLYEMLDVNANLTFVDENKCISGSRGIIEFLVNERAEHLYSSNEDTIMCDIMRVTDGERYGIGEKCILLTYVLESGKILRYIVKVCMDRDRICKLEFFYPQGPLHLERSGD